MEGAGEIDSNAAVEIVRRDVVDASVRRHGAGVVHQEVEAAEGLDRATDGTVESISVGDIQFWCGDLHAASSQTRRQITDRFHTDVGERERPRALACESLGDRRAERTAGARDERGPAREPPGNTR